MSKDRLARPSSWVTSFFLPHNWLGVGVTDFGQVVTQIHQLTGPITIVCDRYVQYLLAGANPSVLNRHRRGYNLGGAGFSQTTLWPSWLTVSTFYLSAPPGLQFNHNLLISQVKFKGHMAATRSFDHSAIYCDLQQRLVIANDLSLIIRFTKIDQKFILMQLRHQSNSYDLMHIQDS
jgi:hypothetical protein